MSLASEIAGILEVRDHKWAIAGELRLPTEDEVQQAIDLLAGYLYDEGKQLSQVSLGGILMVKDAGHVDVYVHIGEHNGN
jgi:hypothetical protein